MDRSIENSNQNSLPSCDSSPSNQCFLTPCWVALPLIRTTPVNHDTKIFEFALPEGKQLNLPVCSCLLLCAPSCEHGGGDAIRPYTPINPPEIQDRIQLLVKIYQEWGDPRFLHSYRPKGAMSNYLDRRNVRELVLFKHVPENRKLQYPFGEGVKTITMLAVGAGIAPMIQALYKLLQTEQDHTKILLLYGNRTVKDILMRSLLYEWEQKYPNQLRVIHVIGSRWSSNVRINLEKPQLPKGFTELCHPRLIEIHKERQEKLWLCPDQESRDQVELQHFTKYEDEIQQLSPCAELGWVNHQAVRRYAFPPAHDTRVFVCGLPAVYDVLCGPRSEKTLRPGTVLDRLGYSSSLVVKF